MSIALTRIDERLIHGQVAYSWSVAYQVNELVVVDDEVAQDEMQKMLLEMAVPEGKSFQLLSIDEGATYLNNVTGKKVFLVVKTPRVVLELVKRGISLDSINIGGMYFKDGKEEITKTVYLNAEERLIFKELAECGVHLDVRTSPSDKSLDLTTKL